MSGAPARAAHPPRHAVVIGFGPVGQMIAGFLAPHGWRLHALDPRPRGELDAQALGWLAECLEVDARRPTPAAAQVLGRCALVVLAVPEQVALETLEAIGPLLPAQALIVETLSRKDRLRPLLAAAVPDHALLSLNPLFHPGLGPRGQRIAVVDAVDRADVADFLACVEDAGARVVRMTAREHDEQLVPVQALTHSALLAFAAGLAEIVPDVERCVEVAPPPTRLLMALAARVASGSPETYWDIQGTIPGQPPARAVLAQALDRLAEDLGHESPEAFAQSLAETRAWFDALLSPLGDLAQSALEHSAESRPPRG